MAMQNTIKIVSAEDVEKYLPYDKLLACLETALANYSQGKDGGIVQPLRSVIPIEPYQGHFLTMPVYSAKDNALTCKLLSLFPHNKDLPTHQAWITHFDGTDGRLLALIEGSTVTSIRTAAASALATKYLANPNASILAILGSGVEARSHYKALKHLKDFDEVRVWSRTADNAKKFAEEIGARVCQSVEEAILNADVICTVTSSHYPILKAHWVKAGAHINAVGAVGPTFSELDPELMTSSVVYCDCKEACLKESGDIILSKCEIYGEIGEVILGKKDAQWKQTTIFKSVGIAIEDLVAAKLVYDSFVQPTSTT